MEVASPPMTALQALTILREQRGEFLKMNRATSDARFEAIRAMTLHPKPFNSPHEGYGVIKEEFDELWIEIMKKHPDPVKLREEATQLAAMALRFLVDMEAWGLTTPIPTWVVRREAPSK